MANISEFSIVDYIVFSVMLGGSLGIGLYFAIKGNKTTDDFLLASRSMSLFPVTLSLIATFFSSISILGYVGEVYGHGLQMAWIIPGKVVGMLLIAYHILPIFYELKLRSINEYLEIRFHSVVLKNLVLAVSILNMLLFLGLCLYAPTLALESVTPLKSTTYVFVLGVVVTLYSSFGGLKAVVWTDAFQTAIIMLGVIIVTLSSITKAGGMSEVWSIAGRHGRLNATNTNLGLYERHTIFNTILIGTVNSGYLYCFSQSSLQRVATLKNVFNIKMMLLINAIGTSVLIILLFVTGLGVFAMYAGCDPISLGIINKRDQILPLYVMEHMGFVKGVPGIFVACLFSGTLSSISSVLNSLPTMLWIDFLSQIPYFKRASENVKTITTKLLTFSLGVVMMALALLASQMGGLIQAGITVLAIVAGPIMGVFVLGVCFPICGKKGAFGGFIVSIVFMTWLAIGARLHGHKTPMLPLTTDHCLNSTLAVDALSGNLTRLLQTQFATITPTSHSPHPLAGLYDISYTFFGIIGLLLCLSVGLLVTFATGREDLETVKPEHVLHCLRRYVGPRKPKKETELTLFVTTTSPMVKTEPNESRHLNH